MASGFQGRVVGARTRKLVRETEKPLTLTPSAFQKMSLTTKQRLASTKRLTLPPIVQPQDKCQKFSAADPEQSSFEPCPPEVVFQNYISGEVYNMPVALRNRDKVPQQVKVTLENSPYFQLVGPSSVHRKVPPGLSTTVHILFTPAQTKDYFHQLVCVTERETFVVPIRAIGARAILDFPDQLEFSECPVKYSSEKTLLVHNSGNRAVGYQLSTQSPFSATPAMGTLDIGDAMQVTVEFRPLKTGDHSASLAVHYDTGEMLQMSIHGRAVDVPIRLDRNDVTFKKTYITLSDRTAVHILNTSDIPARFQWKALDPQKEEDQLKLSLWNARAKVPGDPMPLNNDIFSLDPTEGEIRPSCSAEITMFFKPQAAQVYKHAIYCDISGRENGLLLCLEGEGLGPRLRFKFEELDIGKVAVRAAHSYEAILVNKGPIEAPFSLIPPTTATSSCFTLLPQEGIVAPGGLQVIQISFCPTVLGEFKEEFSFSGTESPKPLTLTIRGCVIGPTFHFDVPALHFGDISFGFPRTLRCCLSNTSLAPMAFTLRIPEDGSGELSICSFNQIYKTSRLSWRKGAHGLRKPREFYIKPCTGTVRSLGSQDIEVTLCSNTVGEYKRELVVDVEGVGKKVLALPLTARCIVPQLKVLNPIMMFGRCCLKLVYNKTLTLLNDSDFPGCYGILPQKRREKAAAWYSSCAPSGIIEAHSSMEIPLSLEARLLGECSLTAELAVFGSKASPLEIHLECTGQGPVVYVSPKEINFGTIPVLKESCKPLHLSNQTDIPAPFRAEMACKHSCWRIEPSKGAIPPRSEVTVLVTANLNDTVKFLDEVKLFIENSPTIIISVQAVGIGTTIVTDKPLAPKLNLNPHFSFTPCHYQFRVTNKGRRIHRLYWTTRGFRIFRRSTHPPALGGTKDAPQTPRPGSPVFKLKPLQMDLRPGQTVEMVLEGYSSTAQEVKEKLLCHALVGKESVKKLIMQVDVTCEFICPAVQMSSRAITFCVEKKPSDVLTLQYKPLSLKNICLMPLSIVLYLEHPFMVCDVDRQPLPADSEPMMLDVGEEVHLCIQFNPAYESNLNSRVAERALRVCFVGHPHEEHIAVRGEVYFPNLRLQAKVLDFGCIVNDTKQVLYMEMTNCSRVPAQYHWSFQTDSQVNTIRFIPSPPTFKPQSSKKKRVFPRRHSKSESVEEPTEASEAEEDPNQEDPDPEDSDQEDPDQEDPDPEDPDQEDPDQEDSDQEDSDQEDPDQEDSDQEGTSQEDSDQEDSSQEYSSQEDSTQEDSTQEGSAQEGSDQADPDEEDPDQEDPNQEDPNQEDPSQEDPAQEDPAQEDSDQEDPSQEDPDQEDPDQEDPAQQPADAEDSLEAEELSSTTVETPSPVRMRGLRRFRAARHFDLGMHEVFDVLPLWGVLPPGQSQLVAFSFFGHANIVARVRALCHVEGGPTYEVTLTGAASCPNYQLEWRRSTAGRSAPAALASSSADKETDSSI